MTLQILLDQLSSPLARGPYRDLSEWLVVTATCPFTGTVERALWGGSHADRLGYAFAAGYAAALTRLFDHASHAQRISEPRPVAPLRGRVALAATESGGAHPRAIATRLDKQGGALVLRGEKNFVTLATSAEEMLVVASRGVEADGRNRLRVVRVSPKAKGVTVTLRPETPFAPEIPHAVVRFDDVHVADTDVLPGDGYDHWLKPFRTIEDVHVLASTVGYLSGAGRAHGFDRAVLAELASLSHSLLDLGARDPGAPLTHLLLAGTFGATRRLIVSLGSEWARSDADERTRWERDLPLLSVAGAARDMRTEAAWKTLSSSC